ncbi:unnamed protein product [Xylocopa violacea]|uniref:Uncharacterized protein n=1 Tax=Xylocopa violacea TaxID=135666 RepID=A0ABP1MZM1_XYLVO
MGNVALSLHNFGSQVNKWSLEKKLLIWRTLAMFACLIGTAVYIRPLEPYLEVPFFGILVPTFITGYILVHSSDILLLMMKKEYIFLVRNVLRLNWRDWESSLWRLPAPEVDLLDNRQCG